MSEERPVNMGSEDASDPGAHRDGITRRRMMAVSAAAGLPLVLAACGGKSGGRTPTSATKTTAEKPVKGGRLRVGSVGSGKSESLDPAIGYNLIDIARFRQLYNGLVHLAPDGSGPKPVLAESIEPNKNATVWNFKLHQGVEFHNGKTMTADDVIYSLRRPFDTKAGLSGSALSAFLNPSTGIKKISATEFELHLKTPVGNLLSQMTGRDCLIYPEGADKADFKKQPIGTGPFKYQSFTPGERSVFLRNDSYWEQGGGPYVDELEIIAINDNAARANALLAGEIDCAEAFDYDQARAYKDNKQVVLLNAQTTGCYPYVFRTDKAPFTDPNVRLAMKLAVDRPKLVDIAFAGFGTVANDMFGKGLPGYPEEPQRKYDPEQAKSLLQKAGHDSLDVTLYYPAENAGQKAAPVYAEQAKAAGINLKVAKFPAGTDFNVAPTFPAFITNWGGDILGVGVWMLSTSTYNEGWHDKGWDKIYHEAAATTDEARRAELMQELNKTWYDQSGHLVWGYYNNVDGLSPKVRGAYPSKVEFGLSNYDYKAYWLAAKA